MALALVEGLKVLLKGGTAKYLRFYAAINTILRRVLSGSVQRYPERLNFWKHCAVNGASRAVAPDETVTSPT